MEACSGGGSSSGGSSAVPAAQSSFSLLSRSSSSFALSFPFLLPADCCAIRHPPVFNALVNGSSQWLVVVLALPNNSTDDLDKSGQRSSYMSSLFITVVFLLLTRGFLSTGRSSSRQTSDDDDHNCGNNGNQPPSISPVTVAFGRRCHHILLSSLRWPLPSAFLPPLLSSDAALSSLTSCSSFSSPLLLI